MDSREEGKAERRARVGGVSLSSHLAGRLRAICGRRGWEWVELTNAKSGEEVSSHHADVIVITRTGQSAPLRGLREKPASNGPVLVVEMEGRDPRVHSAQAGEWYLTESADDEAMATVLADMLRTRKTLEFTLKDIDPDSRQLAHNERAEWVRSRLGIIGMVVVPQASNGPELKEQIASEVRNAHALLDTLPEDQLSLEDLWNLLLFVAVPWTQAEVESGAAERREILDETIRDTSGSRKLILWAGRSVVDHLGPMGRRGTLWLPSSPDPLRDALQATVRDEAELNALEAIFKARISEADLERIVKVLSRGVE